MDEQAGENEPIHLELVDAVELYGVIIGAGAVQAADRLGDPASLESALARLQTYAHHEAADLAPQASVLAHRIAESLADPGFEAAASICHPGAIRTTLDINDQLIATLLARLPGRSKTDAIEHAIEAFLADDSVSRLKQLAGTMDIEDVSREFRKLDRLA